MLDQEFADATAPPANPRRPLRFKKMPVAFRALLGAVVGAVVGVELILGAIFYDLFLVVENPAKFGEIYDLLWLCIPGGLIGAAVGIVGGILWSRWVRALLAAVVMGMAGGILGGFFAVWALPAVERWFLVNGPITNSLYGFLFPRGLRNGDCADFGAVVGALLGAWRGWVGRSRRRPAAEFGSEQQIL